MSIPRATVDLSYCVKNAMLDPRLDYHTTAQYQRCLQRAYRCYNGDMNRFAGVVTNHKTVYLTPNDLFQVTLPKDFVDYRAVGVCINGHMVTLTLCEDICLAHGCDSCGNPISGQTQTVTTPARDVVFPAGYLFLPAWRNGQWVGEQYGIPSGQNFRGYYRFDYANGVIQLSSMLANTTEVVLEYTSSGINLCGQTAIPHYTTEAITAFIVWQSLTGDEREQAKREYWVEYEKVVTFVNSFTGSEAKDEYYSQIRSTPRR